MIEIGNSVGTVAFLTEILPATRPGIAAGFTAVDRNSATRSARRWSVQRDVATFRKRYPKHHLKILVGVFHRCHSSQIYDTYERIPIKN